VLLKPEGATAHRIELRKTCRPGQTVHTRYIDEPKINVTTLEI
jgi:hypothetical protein